MKCLSFIRTGCKHWPTVHVSLWCRSVPISVHLSLYGFGFAYLSWDSLSCPFYHSSLSYVPLKWLLDVFPEIASWEAPSSSHLHNGLVWLWAAVPSSLYCFLGMTTSQQDSHNSFQYHPQNTYRGQVGNKCTVELVSSFLLWLRLLPRRRVTLRHMCLFVAISLGPFSAAPWPHGQWVFHTRSPWVEAEEDWHGVPLMWPLSSCAACSPFSTGPCLVVSVVSDLGSAPFSCSHHSQVRSPYLSPHFPHPGPTFPWALSPHLQIGPNKVSLIGLLWRF